MNNERKKIILTSDEEQEQEQKQKKAKKSTKQKVPKQKKLKKEKKHQTESSSSSESETEKKTNILDTLKPLAFSTADSGNSSLQKNLQKLDQKLSQYLDKQSEMQKKLEQVDKYTQKIYTIKKQSIKQKRGAPAGETQTNTSEKDGIKHLVYKLLQKQ